MTSLTLGLRQTDEELLAMEEPTDKTQELPQEDPTPASPEY